ncbi:MAG: trypsin-like peptidase domain-containing protein [Myxococcota bacterium]|nr:trypsin-like peptidase domain-containing protein [Myxococcota bacterium]
MKAFRKLFATTAIVGLIGTGALLHSELDVTPAYAQRAPAGLTDASIPDVAERVVNSVVNISTAKAVRGGNTPAESDPFFTDPDSPWYGKEPSQKKLASKGSGVIIGAQGRILTNSHVVSGADDITVTLQDGTEHQATIVGQDPRADIAVLQLKGKVPALKPLTFGDSNALRLGEVVLAVGDPFGVGKSVTMGIVSAKGRSGMGIEDYEDFIQTDAAINPGNSGGALVNLRGELVGINTAIASKSGGYAGIGFAIPSNMAKPIMDMLVKDGKVVRGYLGVNIQTVTPALAQEHRLAASRGVYIGGVEPNGPAAKAGLSEGDIIVGFNGVEMKNGDVLRNTIAMMRPGTTVDLEIVRNNAGKKVVKARLGDLEEALKAQNSAPRRRR